MVLSLNNPNACISRDLAVSVSFSHLDPMSCVVCILLDVILRVFFNLPLMESYQGIVESENAVFIKCGNLWSRKWNGANDCSGLRKECIL